MTVGNSNETVAVLETVATEDTSHTPKTLFEFFNKVVNNSKLVHLHGSMNTAKRSILENCSNDELVQYVQLASVAELVEAFKDAFVKKNHERVKIILDTKQIPTNHSCLKTIFGLLYYSNNGDESVCKMAKLLIDYGFDWSYRNYIVYNQFITLGGDYVKSVELLLDSGLNLDQHIDGRNLIQYALEHKRFKVVELLIKRGANTNNLDKTKLPEHLQKMLEKPKTLVQIQQAKIAQLQEQIATVTSVAGFKKYECDITDTYHKFVYEFVIKYNAEHPEFVVSFDGESSVLTVTKAPCLKE